MAYAPGDRAVSETAISLATAVTGDAYEPSESWTEQRDRLIAFLSTEYTCESAAVAQFLRRNSDVAWMLIGAKPALQIEFGGSMEAALTLVSDVDLEEISQRLFVYIRSPLSEGDALDALERFDRSWFLDRLEQIAGRLNFDLGF